MTLENTREDEFTDDELNFLQDTISMTGRLLDWCRRNPFESYAEFYNDKELRLRQIYAAHTLICDKIRIRKENIK